MLEKIGLPPKPSLRGNNWVVDGSHCQGCSSQFTFINRKHHCRRCGGLFCNSCTQQRMFLRGQGDSPVRICEPCKKLEEAARFEKRYGQRSRVGRGDSKLSSKDEDEVLNQILDDNGKESLSSGQESKSNLVSNILRASSSASSSSMQGEYLHQSSSVGEPNRVVSEMGSSSPEELRQQALDEKKKYRVLKGEGKPEEALKAFKRGKELERQAAALEIQLRKSRRVASSSSNLIEAQKLKEDPKESNKRIKGSPQIGKEKDDLAAELKELGWSDMDLRDVDKKPANLSLEGELSSLIGESSRTSNRDKGTHVIDKTEVIALKKKALSLKREGNLAEAKEELKKAKILEKQLEEQEILAGAEDSDDELSSLIHSMDEDRQDDSLSLLSKRPEPGFDFDHLMGTADDIGVDTNFDVTDEDMDDPDIVAALKSFGWSEDSSYPETIVPQSAHIDREAVLSEIQSLKRAALDNKRAGKTADAMALLKKAKILERDLDSLDSQGKNILVQDPAMIPKATISQTTEQLSTSNEVNGEKVHGMEDVEPRVASKSKIMIQRELLGLKKKALAMRREGRVDEAEEELKKAKVLEQQLEELDNTSKVKVTQGNASKKYSDISRTMDLKGEGEEDEDEDITDQDLHDPTYLSLLKNLGWKDEDNDVVNFPSKQSKQSDGPSEQKTESSDTQASSSVQVGASQRSKGEIQRELLGLKRKALALRRQGQTEEADEVLRMTKALEDQMAEMEAPKKEIPVESVEQKENETIQSNIKIVEGDVGDSTKNLQQPKLLNKRRGEDNPQPSISSSNVVISEPNIASVVKKEPDSSNMTSKPLSGRDRFKMQQESLAHKRQSLKLRREGRIEEAEAEFKLAKALETQLEESAAHGSAKSSGTGAEPVDNVGIEDLLDPQLMSALKAIGLDDANAVSREPEGPETAKPSIGSSENSSHERVQLEEEIKAEKVKAVNLKRSGKKSEALDALRRAKLLEKKLSSLTSQ